MKKILIAPILLLSIYATENNESLSKLSPEEHMISHPDSFEKYHPKNHDGYMPKIITPEEEKSGIYAGLALGAGTLNISNKKYDKWDITMLDLSLVFGYDYNSYFGIESRATVSAAYDKGIDLNSLGLYLKPKYDLNKDITLYSLIGIGKTNINQITTQDLKSKKTSAQLGIGANYKIGNNFKIFADYLYMGEDKNAKYNGIKGKVKSSAFTTGITYDF